MVWGNRRALYDPPAEPGDRAIQPSRGGGGVGAEAFEAQTRCAYGAPKRFHRLLRRGLCTLPALAKLFFRE